MWAFVVRRVVAVAVVLAVVGVGAGAFVVVVVLAVVGAVLQSSCWCVVATVVVAARSLCGSGRCRWRCGVAV